MSRNTTNESRGNDGSWFLEAVGALPKAPTPSEVVAELESENTETSDQTPVAASAVTEVVSFDGDPGTSTSSFAPAPAAPPRAPGPSTVDLTELEHLPEPQEATVSDQEHSNEDDLPPVLRSRRNFRWPVVALLVVFIAAAIAAVWWFPRFVNQAAVDTQNSYYTAASGVRTYLPTAQEGLDVITDPSTSSQQVAGSVPVIAELDSRAFALETATAEPLPSYPPFVPTSQLDDLVPLRDRGAILGAGSSRLSRRLGNAYVYRTSVPLLLNTGPLPVAATTQEINEISVQLAASLASDAAIISDLPADPAFDAVAAAGEATLAWYGEWQDAYLRALTGEDTTAATILVAEMDERQSDLADLNNGALLEFRTEADLAIVELAGELDMYMADVNQI